MHASAIKLVPKQQVSALVSHSLLAVVLGGGSCACALVDLICLMDVTWDMVVDSHSLVPSGRLRVAALSVLPPMIVVPVVPSVT